MDKIKMPTIDYLYLLYKTEKHSRGNLFSDLIQTVLFHNIDNDISDIDEAKKYIEGSLYESKISKNIDSLYNKDLFQIYNCVNLDEMYNEYFVELDLQYLKNNFNMRITDAFILTFDKIKNNKSENEISEILNVIGSKMKASLTTDKNLEPHYLIFNVYFHYTSLYTCINGSFDSDISRYIFQASNLVLNYNIYKYKRPITRKIKIINHIKRSIKHQLSLRPYEDNIKDINIIVCKLILYFYTLDAYLLNDVFKSKFKSFEKFKDKIKIIINEVIGDLTTYSMVKSERPLSGFKFTKYINTNETEPMDTYYGDIIFDEYDEDEECDDEYMSIHDIRKNMDLSVFKNLFSKRMLSEISTILTGSVSYVVTLTMIYEMAIIYLTDNILSNIRHGAECNYNNTFHIYLAFIFDEFMESEYNDIGFKMIKDNINNDIMNVNKYLCDEICEINNPKVDKSMLNDEYFYNVANNLRNISFITLFINDGIENFDLEHNIKEYIKYILRTNKKINRDLYVNYIKDPNKYYIDINELIDEINNTSNIKDLINKCVQIKRE